MTTQNSTPITITLTYVDWLQIAHDLQFAQTKAADLHAQQIRDAIEATTSDDAS